MKNKNLSLQRQIFAAVASRGYVEGWLPLQFIARNAVKLLEEACELFLVFEWTHPALINLRNLVVCVREQCQIVFDDKTLWKPKEPFNIAVDLDALQSEYTDCQVVLACLGEMHGVLDNTTYNLLLLATMKAADDIERGIRADKPKSNIIKER